MRACRASQQNVRVYVYVYAWVCLRFVCARVLGVPGEANEEDLQLYVAFQRRNDHLFTPAKTKVYTSRDQLQDQGLHQP